MILAETRAITREHDVLRRGEWRGGLYRGDRAAFAAMRPGAYFINTARGPMVDYGALAAALKSGRLRGAALETFAVEPTPSDLELLKLERVTLTPHIAGASLTAVERAAEAIAEEIRRYLAGAPPLNPAMG